MHRGRRTNVASKTTDVLSAVVNYLSELNEGICTRRSRRPQTSGNTDSPCAVRSNVPPIGLSYLSSSSDSSLTTSSSSSSTESQEQTAIDMPSTSSSQASRNISGSMSTQSDTTARHKSRGAANRSVGIPTQTINVTPSARGRRVRASSRLRSTELPVETNNANGVVASAGPLRYPLPISSKPASTRLSSGRRRSSRTSNRAASPSLSHSLTMNDSVQITGVEQQPEVSNVLPTRLRVGRTVTQPARVSRPRSLSLRTLISSRLNPTPIAAQDRTSLHTTAASGASVRQTNSAADMADLQAALVAVRRPRSNSEGDDDCVICLCEKSNRSVVLPCMHTFCFDCIHRWLIINPSCPLCKRLAERVIHSVLSDTDFAELLVSDLRARQNTQRIGGLSFDLEEEVLLARNAVADNRTSDSSQHQQRQSHHHYHYLMRSPPTPLLDYWNSLDRENTTSLFFPSVVMHTSNLHGPLNADQPRSTFRWNPEFGPQEERHRSLLTTLVNNALRRRNSSLLDGLLLRQLVYILGFNSIPLAQRPVLERDISPDFLATNETQRQRLYSFIRRDLRSIAPWLAFRSVPAQTASTESNGTVRTPREPQAGSAVTAPLICGAPGLLADTPELDAITERLVNHFTSVPMTDENALCELLNSFPPLRSPLVPATYRAHFCSEVIQFARYSGTLEQYDNAVCLYRRRVSRAASGELTESRSFARGPHTHTLLVYRGSACWPRLRPGFAEPQGLITQPLINWLLQRLFVHSISGSVHPSSLLGTGDYPVPVREPLVFQRSHAPCHPHCSYLASLSRELLEAVPTDTLLRSNSVQTGTSNMTGSGGNLTGSSGNMTSRELFPNRLVYQRILSELIDQARFSDALASYFHLYCTEQSSSVNTTASSTSAAEPSTTLSTFVSYVESVLGLNSESSVETADAHSTSPSAVDRLLPALNTHSQALRRLSGLLLLFTARVPSGSRAEHDEDVISELIHTPLMPMTVPPVPSTTTAAQIIDLTVNTHNVDSRLSRNSPLPIQTERCTTLGADTAALSHSDWHFLLRPTPVSWTSLNSLPTTNSSQSAVASNSCRLDPLIRSEANQSRSVEHEDRIGEQQQQQQQQPPTVQQQLPRTELRAPTPPNSIDLTLHSHDRSPSEGNISYSPANAESYWRVSTDPCVVISSDSSSLSSDEEENVVVTNLNRRRRCTRTPNVVEDEMNRFVHMAKPESVDSNTSTIAQPVGCSELLTVENNTSRLSLGPQLTNTSSVRPSNSFVFITETNSDAQRTEEPMDVDEKPDNIALAPETGQLSSVMPGSKRPSSSMQLDPSDSIRISRSTKLSRLSEPSPVHFSIRPRMALYKLHNQHLHHPHRRRHREYTHTRSPIVLDSSGSDCELLSESIHVYSDSCSYTSSSRSSSSTYSVCSSRSTSSSSSSPRTLECSRVVRKSKDTSQHHYPRHRHHHRHHCHGCHKRRKYRCRPKHYKRIGSRREHHSEKHKGLTRRNRHHLSPHSRYYPRLRVVRQPAQTVQLNSGASPILISDEDTEPSDCPDPKVTAETNNELTSPLINSDRVSSAACLSSTKQQHQQPTTESGNSCTTSLPILPSDPCCSQSGGTDIHGLTEVSQSATDQDLPVSEPSETTKTKSSAPSIFEPSNVDEFYRFLAELQEEQSHIDSC